MLSEVPKQFYKFAIISHYVTIIAIIFSIIRIIPKQKVAFLLDFIADYRLIA